MLFDSTHLLQYVYQYNKKIINTKIYQFYDYFFFHVDLISSHIGRES